MQMREDGEKSKGTGTGSSGSYLDPSLPRWLCQMCRHPLTIVGAESYAEKFAAEQYRSGVHASSIHGTGSVLGASRMDHSFVVLSKQRNQAPGFPPRPRPSGIQYPGSFPMAGPNQPVNHGIGPLDKSSPGQTATHVPDSPVTKAMDESFVVLPSAAASMYRNDSSPEAGGAHTPNSGGSSISTVHTNNPSFNSSITVLQRVFDIVSSQTQVEQPLCLECMRVMSEKLDRELEEITMDNKAYEASVENLEGESLNGLSEGDFLREKAKVEEEEKRLEAKIEEIEKQRMDVTHQLQELELKSKRFEEQEEKFWQAFNDFRLQLINHQEERDAILAKIEVTETQLEKLKETNVLNDAFHIWHDGDFGTINNFRLGRLPKIPVEWDEINAAWGQACLLLHTMAVHCDIKFPYRIIPMGSYARMADKNNNTYELYGPVNLFWSTRYDKAMTFFLACLKEFEGYANGKDRAANVPLDKCFKFPYRIENDKVENFTITQSFNKQENWTKALKYMMCDLKWALYWFIANFGIQCPGTAFTNSGQSKFVPQPRKQNLGSSRTQHDTGGKS
uniref:Beclin-1-like protein n=1 Tax=Araucaria cunninghamii TaxID=56994 RepID=A0A0D6R4K7_ARACU